MQSRKAVNPLDPCSRNRSCNSTLCNFAKMEKVKFQEKVKKLFEEKGFTVIERKKFPRLLAYGYMKDERNKPVLISLCLKEANTIKVTPSFFVIECECINGKITKEQHKLASDRLKSMKSGMFMFAYSKNNEILFHEVSLFKEIKNEGAKGYIG